MTYRRFGWVCVKSLFQIRNNWHSKTIESFSAWIQNIWVLSIYLESLIYFISIVSFSAFRLCTHSVRLIVRYFTIWDIILKLYFLSYIVKYLLLAYKKEIHFYVLCIVWSCSPHLLVPEEFVVSFLDFLHG